MKKQISVVCIFVLMILSAVAASAKTTYFDPQLNQTVTRGGDSGIGFVGCKKEFPLQLRSGALYDSYTVDNGVKRNKLKVTALPSPVLELGGQTIELNSEYADIGNNFEMKLLENYGGGVRVMVRSIC